MPRDWLTEALAETHRADSSVRAAALMRIARVWHRLDSEEGARLFERGLAEARSLSDDAGRLLLQNAATIGATIAPRRAMALAEEAAPSLGGGMLPTKQVFEMLSHGHVAESVEYLSRMETSADYPFDAALQTIGTLRDDDARLAVLRGAMSAMRHSIRNPQLSPYFQPRSFIFLFTRHWRRLPEDEARAFIREFTQWLLGQPDKRIRGSQQDLTFSSTREMSLFQLLGPLAHLDPALVESLKAEHPQFASAAERYPFGDESIAAELERRAPAVPPIPHPSADPDPIVAIVGGRPMTRSQAIQSEFDETAFEKASRALAADRDAPNSAPKDAWPSTQMFRRILFHAARAEGRSAVRYLDRIADPDLRLFARIEMAAAVAGLPELSTVSVDPPPPGFKNRLSPPPPLPDSPEAHMLAALMARVQAQSQRSERPFRKPDRAPSLEARVQPSAAGGDAMPDGGSGPDFWVINGAPLRPVIARLYDVAPTRIEIPPALDALPFDFSLVLPQATDRATMERLMREGVERAFAIRRERRPTDVDVLTAPDGIRAKAEEQDWGGGMTSGFVQSVSTGPDPQPRGDHALAQLLDLHMVPETLLRSPQANLHQSMRRQRALQRPPGGTYITAISDAVTMAELCEILEASLDRPLVDETGLTETYRVSAETDHTDPAATRDLLRILAATLGLTVTPVRRDVEWLIVDSR